MTLESVLSRWAQAIQTDPDTNVRSIATEVDGAKLPLARGYIQCVLAGTTNTSADYPFKIKFVSADGSEYAVDLSLDSRTTDTCVTESSAAGGTVPVNNTLLKYMLSSDWEIGSATVFASQRSAGNLYW